MQRVAPHLTSIAAWIEAFLELAGHALAEGRQIDAAYHTRCAEFFMLPSDPRRPAGQKRFIELMLEAFGITAGQIVQVPYGRYSLPGYRFTPEHPRDTIVLFGGGAAACAGEAPRRGGSNHGVPRLAEIACR